MVRVMNVKVLGALDTTTTTSTSTKAPTGDTSHMGSTAGSTVASTKAAGGKGSQDEDDVLLAVRSLDSVIMDKLNSFLWEVEKQPSKTK